MKNVRKPLRIFPLICYLTGYLVKLSDIMMNITGIYSVFMNCPIFTYIIIISG